jgi:general secretion pathway protein L
VTFELSQRGRPSTVSSKATRGNVLENIDRFLRSQKLERQDVELGLELPAECLFSRRLVLPTEVRKTIDAVLEQDLVKRLPFTDTDIYTDYWVTDQPGGTLDVQQWVILRRYVHEALHELGLTIDDIGFAVFDGHRDGQTAPHIRLRRDANRRPFHRTLAVGMAGSAVLLLVASGGLRFWNQQIALDRLGQEVALATRKAQQVRARLDQVNDQRNALIRLRLRHSEAPTLLDLWLEATRILPAHSWLTEFRLAETSGGGDQQVTLAGFSSAAPSLVGTLDASQLFFDAALSSPVAFDPTEGRERFILQAKVRRPEGLKGGSR